MNDTLAIAADVLPIDKIADDPFVLNIWKDRYPSLPEEKVKDLLKRDVAIQYADLCIFGFRRQAIELASISSPQEIYKGLKLMNEIRTYPILFGLNSQANFDYSKLQGMSSIPLRDANFSATSLPPKELEILLDGIGININADIEDIISYHRDSLGANLRQALESFNGYCDGTLKAGKPLSVSEICKRAEILQTGLKEAARDLDSQKYARIDKTYGAITTSIKIGAVAIGGAIALNENTSQIVDVLTILGTIKAAMSALPSEIAELITKIGVSNMDSKFVANMWAAKRAIKRK